MRICEIGVLETDRLGEALSRPHARVGSWCAVEYQEQFCGSENLFSSRVVLIGFIAYYDHDHRLCNYICYQASYVAGFCLRA